MKLINLTLVVLFFSSYCQAEVSLTAYPVSGCGLQDGRLQIVVYGTAGPFSVRIWGEGPNGINLNLNNYNAPTPYELLNLPVGVYHLEVFNHYTSCPIERTATIVCEFPDIDEIIIPACNGQNNGAVILQYNGNSTNVAYSWTSPTFPNFTASGLAISNLPPGEYCVEIMESCNNNATNCTNTKWDVASN